MQPPSVNTPGRPVLRELRQAAADRRVRRGQGVRRRLPRHDVDRPRAAEGRAAGDREVAARPRRAGGRARRDRPARRQRDRDGRRARTSARASSTSPRRRSASRARRSSRSCSRPRSSRESRPGRRSSRSRSRSRSATGPGTCPELRARVPRRDQPRRRDDALGQHRLRAADRDRRPEGSRARPPASLGVTQPAQPVLRDRARRRGGQPARARARVRGVPDRRAPHRRVDLRQRSRARSSASSSPDGKKPLENEVRPVSVLRKTTAQTVNSLLQHVVQSGTGKRAALADRPVAGKTGTTENYGDAWFVGYTPQLVVAVWVGDPDTLKPMLTEFHGDPVAGGTFPALIWKSFAESALRIRGDEPESFSRAAVPVRHDEARHPQGRPPAARQRPLPRRALDRLLQRPTGRSGPRTASRTRSRFRASSARRSTSRGSGSRRSRSSP